MLDQPYSLATDSSNDGGGSAQLYPVLLTYFNHDKGTVEHGLLSLPACVEDSTGEKIYELMNTALAKYKIPWNNCVSLSTDNASVMVGKHKGVFAYILKENPG